MSEEAKGACVSLIGLAVFFVLGWMMHSIIYGGYEYHRLSDWWLVRTDRWTGQTQVLDLRVGYYWRRVANDPPGMGAAPPDVPQATPSSDKREMAGK